MDNSSDKNIILESSSIIEKIGAALKKYNDATGLHISITEKGATHSFEDGRKALIKWLCWNLTGDGDDFITAPDLVSVSAELCRNELEKIIKQNFSKYKCVIDNDIQIE